MKLYKMKMVPASQSTPEDATCRTEMSNAGARDAADTGDPASSEAGHVHDTSSPGTSDGLHVDCMSQPHTHPDPRERRDDEDDIDIRTRMRQSGWTPKEAWLPPGSAHSGGGGRGGRRDQGTEQHDPPPQPKSRFASSKKKERDKDANEYHVKPFSVPAEERLHPTMSAIGRASREAARQKAEPELARMKQTLELLCGSLTAIRTGAAVVTIVATGQPSRGTSTARPKQSQFPMRRGFWPQLLLAWSSYWASFGPAAVMVWLIGRYAA